jgi:hypothetical protein
MKGVFNALMAVLIFTEKELIGCNYNVAISFFPNYLHSILALYASELSEAYVHIC